MDRCLPQPRDGARVLAPVCRLQLPVCAWGAEAFMTSVAHLPGTTRAWAAPGPQSPLSLAQYQAFPSPGGGPPGSLSTGSWGWSGRHQRLGMEETLLLSAPRPGLRPWLCAPPGPFHLSCLCLLHFLPLTTA